MVVLLVKILINNFDFHIIFTSYTKTEMLYSVYTPIACVLLCYSFYFQLLPSLVLSSTCSLFELTSFFFISNFNPSLSCEQL